MHELSQAGSKSCVPSRDTASLQKYRAVLDAGCFVGKAGEDPEMERLVVSCFALVARLVGHALGACRWTGELERRVRKERV